jgi:hypothetical protein
LLDSNDVVISKDTKEMLFIRDDYQLFPIKSRVYRFVDYETAEKVLNESADTYDGQIVSVLSDQGNYEAYIVNHNNRGLFTITPLNVYSGSIDYDNLGHKPITNLYGEALEPVILDEQKDGFYAVNGNYKITQDLETVFSSVSNNFFIISHESDGKTTIKKIGSDEIIDYYVQNGNVTSSTVPTQNWLQAQGYITEGYVDQKLEAMGIITKTEIEQYVTDIVLQTIENTVEQTIEDKFNERFEKTSEREVLDMFTKNRK